MSTKILPALTIALEFVFVPMFLKAMWPKKTMKSLLLKMTCSTLFIATGVLAVQISGNRSNYAKLILVGLLLGWLGDFFLHVKDSPACFMTGLLSFMGGHVVYIWAFCLAIKEHYPGASFFSLPELAGFAAVFAGAAGYAAIKKMRFGPALAPVAVYTAILTVMFVKACSLGVRMMVAAEPPAAGLIYALLVLGAVAFLISDALLAVMIFGGQKTNYRMKIVNIVTYFAAQNMLALTILFIA